MAAINHWPWSTKSSIPLTILFFLSFLFYRGSVFAGHGQFLLITDFHLDNQYDQLGNPFKMCHRENETPKRTTGQQLGAYGDHDCDAPPALVEFMLDEAKRHLPEPDFIIWTGDNPAHVDYTRSEFLRTMKDATESMRKHFDNILVIPVLGNHDFLPSNNFDDNPEEFWPFQEIFEMWKDWIGDEAKETFTHGGYYRFKSHGADFLVLNTNVYYMWNTALDRLSHPDDPLGQFSFIEEQLADIKRLGGKINIIAHVPPGAFEWDSWGTQWSPMMPKQYNQRLVNLFVEYAPNIRWMLFGHFHTDTFRILKDANEKPVHVMFMNPSVTPIFQLNNPAFRVFEYNITDMEITDIKTFYVDLDQLNKEGAGRVHSELEYSMREAYNLDALNAETMNRVLERMAQNQSLFLDYAIRNKVQFISPNSSEPDRAVHLCVMGNVDLDELEHCLHSVNAAFALRLGITTSAIFVFFSMVFTFLLNQMLLSNITIYTNFYSI